jgi:hypothetical protein
MPMRGTEVESAVVELVQPKDANKRITSFAVQPNDPPTIAWSYRGSEATKLNRLVKHSAATFGTYDYQNHAIEITVTGL